MRRLVTCALLPVSLFLLTGPGCGGSTTGDSGGQGTTGGQSTGGQSTTGGNAGTGGRSTTGGNAGTGGQLTTGGQGTGGSAGESSDICSLPPANGADDCKSYIPMFWHNPNTHECEPFIWGGCGGNANRFESLALCREACGGKPSLTACDHAGDCALTNPGCCGACEPLEITDLVSINGSHLSDRVCDVACAPCPPLDTNERATRNYFVSACVMHQCTVVDVRKTELTSCNVDSDCRLRLGAECCEACTGEPVAVNASANLCPDGALPCPKCAITIPPGYTSVCVEGRCTVNEPPCTLAHPCP